MNARAAEGAMLDALSITAVAARNMRASGGQTVVNALMSLRLGARPKELAGIDAAISVAKQKVADLRREEVPAITYQKVRRE